MIDKQKLLQWVEHKLEIYTPSDSDTEKETLLFRGRRKMLYTLQRDIELGEFDVEEVAHERTTASSKPSAS